MFFRKKKKDLSTTFDTSRKAWEEIGIQVSEEQYYDLCEINMFLMSSLVNENYGMVMHHIMLILRTLNLLPVEKRNDKPIDVIAEKTEEIRYAELQKKYGRIKNL